MINNHQAGMSGRPPNKENNFYTAWLVNVDRSFQSYTGKSLFSPDIFATESAEAVYLSNNFALLTHDGTKNPRFNYANEAALSLFKLSWNQMIGMPSRLSASANNQEDRDRLLKHVHENGWIDNYHGPRVAADGSEFIINNATVWNVSNDEGLRVGQAALIPLS